MSGVRSYLAVLVVLCVVAAGCNDSPDSDGANDGTSSISAPATSAASETSDLGSVETEATSPDSVTSKPETSEPEASEPQTSQPETSSESDTSQPETSSESDPQSTGGSAGDDRNIDWRECNDESATAEELRCATITVPLDYEDDTGETIDLALVMVPASGDRTGAVLFNPGGPGGSGFDYVAQAGTTIASALGLGGFDLIGFDPRGVDRSGGITCLSDADLDKYAYPDFTPDTPQEDAFLQESEDAFADACADKYGDSLQHYSTSNTARDMDEIRAALGDETISYLGISYGTYLGAVYATMFAERVRAMVLDSAFEPSGDSIEQQYTTQLVGFENAFTDWAEWCQEESTCVFQADLVDGANDVALAWDLLRDRLDDDPITNSDGRIGNQAVLERATKAALYSKTDWPVLAAGLAKAADGDPSGLFRLADAYFSRDEDGSYATIKQSNAIINCASGIEAESPADPDALAAELRRLAPRFGRDIDAEDLAEGDGCIDLMPPQPPDVLSYDGDAPIVVVGGKNDPATPFRWAEEMTAAMGSSARLVTFTGEGHGQLLASACVTEIEAELLSMLSLPDQDTICDPDPDVPQPAWWDSLSVPAGVGEVMTSPELSAALGLSTTLLYSEIRTSDRESTDVLAAYRRALEDDGLEFIGEQEQLAGITQAVYSPPTGDGVFSILVVGAEGFEDPLLEPAAPLLPEGEVLVILLYVPA